jgi:hypothetical protein
MSLVLRWQHEDGSVVEFSTAGWKSDDPVKARLLNQMSDLTSLTPVISPLIRMWLQAYCEPIELRGQPEVFSSATDQNVSQTGVEDEAFRAAGDGQVDDAGEEVKRRMRITIRSVANACDEFFRSRGMSIKVRGKRATLTYND